MPAERAMTAVGRIEGAAKQADAGHPGAVAASLEAAKALDALEVLRHDPSNGLGDGT